MVFVEVPGRGFILSDPETVSQFKRRWEILRNEALLGGLSVNLMKEATRQWSS